MKRSELYALVWEKPVIRLAKELGVSDVGLAKACRRHDIPIPPRGHWTKLQFGKSSPKTALPPQDQDSEVQLTIPTPREIARKEKRRVLVKAVEHVAEQLTTPQFEISAELLKLHPLVKATNTYLRYIRQIAIQIKRLGAFFVSVYHSVCPLCLCRHQHAKPPRHHASADRLRGDGAVQGVPDTPRPAVAPITHQGPPVPP